MDYLSLIQQPIGSELAEFVTLFNDLLSYPNGLLNAALTHIRQRGGKRMRPILILLMAKNFGRVSPVTLNAAASIELLHTCSLVHDDVVDESDERRGQASVNATYNNKVAVLVGDYIISSALLSVSRTHNTRIIERMAELGRTLAVGEILQLTNIDNKDLSEDVYYQIIERKTAVLFESSAQFGAISAGASEDEIAAAGRFGHGIGMIFQIRDDIFDYFDSPEIGKPTGNDMTEGKLTLPVLHALNTCPDNAMLDLAMRVKGGKVSSDEIARLVAFTKANGGIDYAEQKMAEIAADAQLFIDQYAVDGGIKSALKAYLDYVIERRY